MTDPADPPNVDPADLAKVDPADPSNLDPADPSNLDPAAIDAAILTRPYVDPAAVAAILNRLPGVQGKPKAVMHFARLLAAYPYSFKDDEDDRELLQQLQKVGRRLRRDLADYPALTRSGFREAALRAFAGTPLSQVSDVGEIVHSSLKLPLALVQQAMAAVRRRPRGRPPNTRQAELAMLIAWAFQELTGKAATVSITRGSRKRGLDRTSKSAYVQTCKCIFDLFGLSAESAVTAAKNRPKFDENLG